ncbi:MAG: methyltransferase family protein [Methanomicrobiales archaeon]
MENWKSYILSFIWGPLLVIQFLLVFLLGFVNEAGLNLVMYAGWIVWVISLIFGWLPIIVLKREGGVEEGKSYINTTTLVKTNIYAIVRHPQYTAGILFSLALILISQNLFVTTIGIIIIILLYIDILMTDKYEIEKFGDEYVQYMKEVPRTNFILGIVRWLKNK